MIFCFKKIREKKASASVASAVAIFVSVALVFGGVKLYQIESKGASIQESADASALAAEGEVAKFYTIANTADTAILAMNTTEAAIYAASVISACVGNIPLSADLAANATKVGNARTKFATQAKKTLNQYQKALPAIAAGKACLVGSKNTSDGTELKALAVLVPKDGVDLNIDTSELDSAGDDVKNKAEDAKNKGEELQKLEEELSRIDAQAYYYDCGANPGYCLYERAGALSSISGSSNPFYSSADSWDFNVAFMRSKAYFNARKNDENPLSYSDVREQARSYLRADYYKYVSKKINECYSKGKGSGDLYDWPDIYHDAQGFRESEEYGKVRYPVTEADGIYKMHANSNLPCAQNYVGWGSCAGFDAGGYEICEICEFSASNTGNIGSATTNTKSGFEHYFQAIKDLKRQHDDVQQKYDEAYEKMKGAVDDANGSISNFLSAAKRARITPEPPGRDGAVGIVVVNNNSKETTISNAFVKGNIKMGKTAAVSGAVLKVDEKESGLGLITERLKGSSSGSGAASETWQNTLSDFGNAKSSSSSSLDSATGDIKGAGKNKISKYSQNLFGQTLDSFGLAPSDLSAYKPVITNTSNVVKNDDGKFATTYKKIQENALKSSTASTDLFSSLESVSTDAIDGVFSDSKLTIASVDIPIIGKIGVDVDIGSQVTSAIKGQVQQAFDTVRNTKGGNANLKTWK